jgi:hypothetical protein
MAQNLREKLMQNWEYAELVYNPVDVVLEGGPVHYYLNNQFHQEWDGMYEIDVLNIVGAEGWEVIIYSENGSRRIWQMKRPKA